jgi:hypothetical protein
MYLSILRVFEVLILVLYRKVSGNTPLFWNNNYGYYDPDPNNQHNQQIPSYYAQANQNPSTGMYTQHNQFQALQQYPQYTTGNNNQLNAYAGQNPYNQPNAQPQANQHRNVKQRKKCPNCNEFGHSLRRCDRPPKDDKPFLQECGECKRPHITDAYHKPWEKANSEHYIMVEFRDGLYQFESAIDVRNRPGFYGNHHRPDTI